MAKQKKASSTPDTISDRPSLFGRFRAAWYVLCGSRLVHHQIQSEWLDYQVTFNDLINRWSALLARQAKAEKKRMTDQLDSLSGEPAEPALVASPGGHKAYLRSLVAGRHQAPSRSQPGGSAAPLLVPDDHPDLEEESP